MRLLQVFSLVGLSFCSCQFAFADVNPFSPALAGKIECFNPNLSQKTCDTLTVYKPKPDGTFDENDVMVLSTEPFVTTVLNGIAFAKNGMICQKFDANSLAQATFELDGKPIDAKVLDTVLPNPLDGFKAFVGKTSCMRLTETPEGLLAEFELDGVALTQVPPQYAIWVNESEGYKLLGR